MKIIIIPTIPHTGTHSIISFIDHEGYKEFRHSKCKRSPIFPIETGTHNHIVINEIAYSWSDFIEVYEPLEHPLLHKDKINVIHGHLNSKVIGFIDFVYRNSDIIMPCRDPLLSIITTYHRKNNKQLSSDIRSKGKKHYEKLKLNFEEKIQEDYSGIDFIIKDYAPDYKDKTSGARRTMQIQFQLWKLWAEKTRNWNAIDVPIDLEHNICYEGRCFKSMKKLRTSGDYPLKEAYMNKDIDFIKEKLDKVFDLLREQEPILRPSLEKLGYKGLMWWS